ncbi:MAG: carbohydrate kinase family protein [Methylococcaceae bacterium]
MTHRQIGIFGEVLFDQFPDGQQVLGGAPFNVAWHLQAFGQRPCFISRVGADAMGAKIRQAMMDWGMAVDGLQTDPDYPTGTVQVIIDNGEPGYAILANQAYDFIDSRQLDLTRQFSIIYHGTLALRNHHSQQALNDLTTYHEGKVFLDVNLRTPWWQAGAVIQAVNKADWLKLNQEELVQLRPVQNNLQDTMQLFRTEHDLDALIVTCGSQGAMAINKAGEFFEVAPERDLSVVDTVGAGDAFSAVLLLGMQHGWSLPVTMSRAQSFASALVTKRGATVQDLSFYQAFMNAWNLD